MLCKHSGKNKIALYILTQHSFQYILKSAKIVFCNPAHLLKYVDRFIHGHIIYIKLYSAYQFMR